MKQLLIAGFNPAWQQTFVLDDLTLFEVNRASKFYECASGKGINALRAVEYLGKEAALLQFVGGERGEKIQQSLSGVTHYSLFSESVETRVCTTLISKENGNATEIVGSSMALSNEFEMLELISRLPKYDGLLISGSNPEGISPQVYRSLCLAQMSAIKIIDAYKYIEILFDLSIDLLKINLSELLFLSKELSLEKACDWIFAKSKVNNLFITDGGNATWVVSKDFTIKLLPPEVKVVNPIGAGDTLAGFLLAHLVEKFPSTKEEWHELASEGLALASQSCMNVLPGLIKDKGAF